MENKRRERGDREGTKGSAGDKRQEDEVKTGGGEIRERGHQEERREGGDQEER